MLDALVDFLALVLECALDVLCVSLQGGEDGSGLVVLCSEGVLGC